MREYYNRGTGEEKRGSREDLGEERKEVPVIFIVHNFQFSSQLFSTAP